MLLLDWLLHRYPRAKRQTLKRMVQTGRVTVNAEPARKLKHELAANDVVGVSDRVPQEHAPRASALQIVYEDQDILVINKPPGLLTSTTSQEHRPTALARVREYLGKDRLVRIGLIHRLDRDASGLLVFSKNAPAYQRLKRQFFHHTAQRIYAAVVEGLPKQKTGRIESRLVEWADGSVHSTRRADQGQQAVTEYKVMSQAGNRALLRVKLHTGRKHQIRAHLSARGTPIVGDKVYGGKVSVGTRLMLAATELSLDHPHSGKRMTFKIEIPAELTRALPQLSGRQSSLTAP
jgi:23S rRNA pseudouridine1911/1915/1917 synthase